MCKFLAVLLMVCHTTAGEEEAVEPTASDLEERAGSISLNNSDASTLLGNAIYIVPVLIFIIILDFAIFGTYASRTDDLNPISDFFYHVRRGFGIVSQKSGAAQVQSSIYQKYHNNRKHKYQQRYRVESEETRQEIRYI